MSDMKVKCFLSEPSSTEAMNGFMRGKFISFVVSADDYIWIFYKD